MLHQQVSLPLNPALGCQHYFVLLVAFGIADIASRCDTRAVTTAVDTLKLAIRESMVAYYDKVIMSKSNRELDRAPAPITYPASTAAPAASAASRNPRRGRSVEERQGRSS